MRVWSNYYIHNRCLGLLLILSLALQNHPGRLKLSPFSHVCSSCGLWIGSVRSVQRVGVKDRQEKGKPTKCSKQSSEFVLFFNYYFFTHILLCPLQNVCVALPDLFFFYYYFLQVYFFVPCKKNVRCLTWVRHSSYKSCATHSYPFLSVCVVYSCVRTVLWLPVSGIFNVHTDANAGSCMQGLYRHRKRVCTESWLWGKKTCCTGDLKLNTH